MLWAVVVYIQILANCYFYLIIYGKFYQQHALWKVDLIYYVEFKCFNFVPYRYGTYILYGTVPCRYNIFFQTKNMDQEVSRECFSVRKIIFLLGPTNWSDHAALPGESSPADIFYPSPESGQIYVYSAIWLGHLSSEPAVIFLYFKNELRCRTAKNVSRAQYLLYCQIWSAYAPPPPDTPLSLWASAIGRYLHLCLVVELSLKKRNIGTQFSVARSGQSPPLHSFFFLQGTPERN